MANAHIQRILRPSRPAGGVLVRAALAGLAALSLSACITTDPGHDPAARALSLDYAEVSHQVAFAPGQGRLPRSSASRLDSFLRSEQVERGDHVFVLSRPVLADEKQDRLAADRESSVAAHLALRGIEASMMAGGAQDAAGAYAPADSVTVLVRRAVVVTPNCPDWGSLGTTDELIGEERDFGCITATALGSTLSDPSDLEGGRDPGAFDGEAVSKSVQRYRDGKTKEPVATNTQKGK